MPSKYIVRNLKEKCLYHIYNRSGGERNLFSDTQDYRVFLFYLYIYTNPVEDVIKKFSDLPMRLREKSLAQELDILAYSLMPDHFHLVIKQLNSDGMPKLMKQVVNGFTLYYNRKYKHRGAVFQGRYKATEVAKNSISDLVRYIHREPVEKKIVSDLKNYEWTSYKRYVGEEAFLEFDVNELLNQFDSPANFIEFTHDLNGYKESLDVIEDLIIE